MDTARTRYLGAKPPKPVGASLPPASDPIELAAAVVEGYIAGNPADFEAPLTVVTTTPRPVRVERSQEQWIRPAPPPEPRAEPVVLRVEAAEPPRIRVETVPFDVYAAAVADIRTALPVIEEHDPERARQLRVLLDAASMAVEDDDGEEG